MPEIGTEVKCAIEQAIMRVEKKFKDYPDVFLTEEDLRCDLFSELMKEDVLSRFEKTWDNSYSTSVHSEVRWYGRSKKKLRTRSDLVILDVARLRTSDDGLTPLPSKGYGFGEPLAVIETKLRRIKGPSDRKWKDDLLKDINKIQELIREIELSTEPRALYYLVVFDKKKDMSTEIPKEDVVKIHYVAVPMRNNRRRTREAVGIL